MQKIVHRSLIIILLICCKKGIAQQVDIEGLKNVFKAKPIRFSGGVAANTAFYSGNGNYGRAPFTWFLQGNLNANIFGKINLPFSFNLTNASHGITYPTPPNRLSLHPTYKWIAGHIGDVAMSFSPYTLSGHQFTGAGVDLTPDGPWKISAMAGRLQKAVQYDSASGILPVYKRMGYGAKVGYNQKMYRISISAFAAKDVQSSLSTPPDSLLIFPGQNLALHYEVGLQPLKGLDLTAGYATSVLTRDVRDSTENLNKGVSKVFLRGNGSTAVYHALKTQLSYNFRKSTVGAGYERIDPGYQTYGTYYFNNDLENITVNLAQSLLRDKASISANIGIQRDNLDYSKSGTTRRWVGALNLNYAPSERWQTSFSYSNFQTYMSIRPQFEYINQLPYQQMDTLNFTQISQNANLNVNVLTKKSEQQMHSLNMNLNFQDASDDQGGTVAKGNSSQFYNMAASYGIQWLQQGMNLTAAYNVSYNTIARNDFMTMGPTVSFMTKMFKKKMSSGLSASYNFSKQDNIQISSVLSVRLNASYTVFKKHRLNLNLVNQIRETQQTKNTTDLTGTMGYSYSF
ncbi:MULTISPECIES: TonB-dependent receptor [Niastella]|uniref:Outer membrane protein beta-barrel domain-containing protein n=1 Tax=Niastella soli TaxID=2821487 RepID=A0ABS3Z045_9BACT|nr:hypothetical protein [Niastella soli]MBO9203035.1 hypothetical protein [Niastella soli]